MDGSTDPVIQLEIEEGKGIIAKASRLKYRMARDQEPISEDGEFYPSQAGKNTWFAAWIYSYSHACFTSATCKCFGIRSPLYGPTSTPSMRRRKKCSSRSSCGTTWSLKLESSRYYPSHRDCDDDA
ncbi:hypothetical protein EDD17DRAFT_1651321 [Pisolithus thermaeus]|nr:hypothetical protein EDD17DRAFT_1651321 [Pisolithus thermaeus]